MTTVTATRPTDNLRKVLKACANKEGEGNLEDHIQKVFNFLIQHYPSQALEKLEEASYLLKTDQDITKFMKISCNHDYSNLAKDLEAYSAEMQKHFAQP
jgi:hypothetical protein